MYDLIIIGGGPAGVAAAVYAARKQLKTVFITGEWGGQSVVSEGIENWIGTPRISGADLAKNLRAHAEANVGDHLQIVAPDWATETKTFDDHVEVLTKKGQTLSGKTLFVATGSSRRKLDVPGAAEHDNKGLTYCASCDGPLFGGQDVAVVGGGNAAFESALQLLAYCKSVTLLNRTDTFRADEVTVEAAKKHDNFKIITNALVQSIEGAKFVSGITYKDARSGAETLLPVTGVFVEIGLLPSTEWLGTAVEKNVVGQITVNPRTQRTSHPRIWAAGDCTDGLYHQNNIAAGDAVKALEDLYLFLKMEK